MNRQTLVILSLTVALAAVATFLWHGRGTPAAGAAFTSALVQKAGADEIKTFIKSQNSPVVLVNFWASWCEPCKVEFPMIMELREKYAARGLKVVFVSIDEDSDIPAADAFLKTQKGEPHSFVKGSQSFHVVTDIFPGWRGAVPMTLLMGPDLKILDAWEGEGTLKEFEDRVTPHLKGT